MALTRDALFWTSFSGHAERTVAATKLLEQMLANPDDADRINAEVKKLEHEGDKITHDTVQALHTTWITPLDRDAIHALITKLDDVLDYVDSASDRIALYEVRDPPEEIVQLAAVLSASAAEIAKAVGALTKIEDGKEILALCRSINKHEHDADTLYRRGIARLFKETKDPFLFMKWRDIYESLETATDRAEDVANIIEGIVLEHA
jgi:predicted phosphate transport protein (TIGR00153 family)